MRFFLVSPANNSIFGGIKIINLHAHLLEQAGHEVYIADHCGVNNYWMHKSFKRVISCEKIGLKIDNEDAIICYWNSKVEVEIFNKYPFNKKYFVALNTQPKVSFNGEKYLYGEDIYDLSWDAILCSSEYLKDCIKEHNKSPKLIKIGADEEIFKPKEKVKNTVAYFDRRGSFVEKNKEFLNYLGLSLVPIKNKKELEVAEILSNSEYFLSITEGLFEPAITGRDRVEGWNMPAQEAMLSGCAVIGYTAKSAPFMRDDNSWIVNDYDEDQFRVKIIECLNTTDEIRYEKIENGVNLIKDKYSLSDMNQTLLEALNA